MFIYIYYIHIFFTRSSEYQRTPWWKQAWHLIFMNRIVGQHHMVFQQNHLAVLQNMTQVLLLLQL